MGLNFPFKVENRCVFTFSICYLVAATVLLFILAISSFEIVTIGFLGVLSLMAAYGLFRMKTWAVWLVAALFFPEITFGVSVIYSSIVVQLFFSSIADLLVNLATILYLIFCFVSIVYIVKKRDQFS